MTGFMNPFARKRMLALLTLPSLAVLAAQLPAAPVAKPAAAKSAAKPAAKPAPTKAKPVSVVVTLPDAYGGMNYDVTLAGPLGGLGRGALVCGKPSVAFPSWIVFNCNDLHFTGAVPATPTDAVTEHDVLVNDKVLLKITLPRRASAEVLAIPAASGTPRTVSATMPDAYPGRTYDVTLGDPLAGLARGVPKCPNPPPALPTWLTFTCTGLRFSGTVPASDVDVPSKFTVVLTDVAGVSAAINLNLVLRPTIETLIVAGGSTADAAPAASAPPAKPTSAQYSGVTLRQQVGVAEGQTTLSGWVDGLPTNGSLHLKVNLTPFGGASQAAVLTGGGAQVDVVKSGDAYMYKVPLAAPLAGGEIVDLIPVMDDGTQVGSSLSVALPSAINIPGITLNLTQPVSPGSTLTGTVTMPAQAAPTMYPAVRVYVEDATSGAWNPADLTSGTPVVTSRVQTVDASGNFTLTLKNPLAVGQRVRVDAIAPPGRSFAGFPAVIAPPPTLVPDLYPSVIAGVINNVALIQPSISTAPLNEAATSIKGNATPGATSVVGVAVLRLKAGTVTPQSACLTQDSLAFFTTADRQRHSLHDELGDLLEQTSGSSSALYTAPDPGTGAYSITLDRALKEGEKIQVIQVLATGTILPAGQFSRCGSQPLTVTYPFEFHRTNLTFVAGVLISNSSSGSSTNANFSQANQFYSFNADHAVRLPGYDCVMTLDGPAKWGRKEYGSCTIDSTHPAGWHASPAPGFSTFFEGRLTSIPVSTAATLTNVTSGTATTGTTTTGTTTTGTAATQPSTLLTSQKVLRVEIGWFLPWVISHGAGDHPLGIFAAPLAKAGFDTVAGSTNNNVVLQDGSTGTLNYQSAYNFYSYGLRFGNVSLSQSHNRAPQIDQFLDVTVGRYSNLQSYVCHQVSATHPVASNLPGSSCSNDYPTVFLPATPATSTAAAVAGTPVVESRKQLYRIDLEGLVRIPIPKTAIPFFIGFNANIAQHSWQAENLDHGYAPPDDIRILFGTKIDIGQLLTSLNLGPH